MFGTRWLFKHAVGIGSEWSEDILGSAMSNQYWQTVKSKNLVGFWVINYSLETPNLYDLYILHYMILD